MTDVRQSKPDLRLVICPNHGAQTCGCYRCDDWQIVPVVPAVEAEELRAQLRLAERRVARRDRLIVRLRERLGEDA